MPGYVVDASVLVEVFVAGQFSEQGLAFLEQAASNRIGLYAPDIIYNEVAAALRKHEVRTDYKSLGEDVSLLADLNLNTTPARELLFLAVDIAQTHQQSVYDSFYLALSNRLGFLMVTVDRRLVNGVKGKPFQVTHLEDLII